MRRSARSPARSVAAPSAELLLGEQAGLDPLGEVDLLLGGEQLGAADAVEVGPHQVGGDAALVLDVCGVLARQVVRPSTCVELDRCRSSGLGPLVRCVLVFATSARLPVSAAGVEPALVTGRSFARRGVKSR